MTYNPSIPAINTRIDQTYNLITTNFNQLNVIFNADHYQWNYVTVGDRGLHRQVTLLQQAAPAAGALRGEIYTIKSPLTVGTTRTEPYYRYDTAVNIPGGGFAGLQAPVIPFKAFAAFDSTAAAVGANIPPASIFQAYNIATILRDTATDYIITFTNKLDDQVVGTAMEYVVFLTTTQPAGLIRIYYDTLNSGLSLQVQSAGGANTRISFGVMTL